MITVTGASGNIGSRIVNRLRGLNHEVRAVIGPNETPPWAPEPGLEIVAASFADTITRRRLSTRGPSVDRRLARPLAAVTGFRVAPVPWSLSASVV